MIDRDQGQIPRQGVSLGEGQADHDPADQAGAGGRRHGVEVGGREIARRLGLSQGQGAQVVDGLDVGAGGDFRHHAAIDGVLDDLGMDQVAQHARAGRVTTDDGDGGFIAGGFDAEDGQRLHPFSKDPEKAIVKPFALPAYPHMA